MLLEGIRQAAHRVSGHLDATAQRVGVGQAEAHVLVHLHGGPATPGGLHRQLGLRSSTLTNVIDRLEAAGYVDRRVTRDRRSKEVHLTAAGKRAAVSLAGVLLELEQRVRSSVTERDLAGCMAVLAAIEQEASDDG